MGLILAPPLTSSVTIDMLDSLFLVSSSMILAGFPREQTLRLRSVHSKFIE